MSRTVFYMNPGATADVRDIVEQQLPPGWRLTAPGPDGDFRPHLTECDYVVVADRAVSADHLAAAPRLKMIQHQGVGYEKIDLAACRSRKIIVGLTPEGTSVGVAEHTLLLILSLYRQLVKAANGVQQGQWMQWELRGGSFELYGKRLGLVGLGRIGREVARRALSFDAEVSYFDPLVARPSDLAVTPATSLQELFTQSDIVSLHVPLTAENRALVNDRSLAWMKPGAVLVNTARGGLVDEGALARALDAGRLGGAALDVLNNEPPSTENPLLGRDNVLITPHISAGTRDALVAKMRAVFANLLRHWRGEPILNVVPELADLTQGA